MKNKHKLDILFEGLNNLNVPQMDGSTVRYFIKAEHRINKKNNFGVLTDFFQCKIEVDTVLVFFDETVLGKETTIEKAKDWTYNKILTYLFLIKLKAWKQSMEDLNERKWI